MQFVPATQLTLGSSEIDNSASTSPAPSATTTTAAVDKGATVKSFYESLVGLPLPPRPLERAPPRPPQPEPDLDLTLGDSASDDDEDQATDAPNSDEDLVILDSQGHPETTIPRPPRIRRRRQPPPPPPAALLPTSLTPHAPPIQYILPETSFGYSLLRRQGWHEGQPLGPKPVAQDNATAPGPPNTHFAQRLIVPLKPVEKHDRRGLGPTTEESRREQKEAMAARKREKEERRRAGQSQGVEAIRREQKREEWRRRELLAHLNH